MKRVLLNLLCLIIAINGFAQVQGGFYYGTYTNGSKYIYFKATNVTNYNFQVNICAVNEIRNERKDWSYYLISGNSFTISPNDGWIWLKGEKLWIQYPNGASGSWTNFLSLGTPSFTGSLHCAKCGCRSWGGGSNYNSPCPNRGCNHRYVDHNRPGD